MSEGLRVEASRFGACQGIYLSGRPWTLIWKDVVQLSVAIRVTNPIRVGEVADLPEAAGMKRRTARPDAVREELLDRGHDAALTEVINPGTPNANQFIVALLNERVRIIVADDYVAT